MTCHDRQVRIGAALLFALAVSAAPGVSASSGGPDLLPVGKGKFVFFDARLNQGRPLNVFTYVPAKHDRRSPVLFVMHGNTRNADDYRDEWAAIAERRNAVLVCPEFSVADFPRDTQYNLGNMFVMDEADRMHGSVPETNWTFALIEPIFDLVQKMTGNAAKGYLLYGHSAGAQFVHRFLYFVPKARVLRAVSANAGWYTFPDDGLLFPYGLKGSGMVAGQMKDVFAKNVTILLGDADIDTESSSLRKTPEALAQGPHRFARGTAYFAACQDAARSRGFRFLWRLATAPGVAHSNSRMAPFAEKALFDRAEGP